MYCYASVMQDERTNRNWNTFLMSFSIIVLKKRKFNDAVVSEKFLNYQGRKFDFLVREFLKFLILKERKFKINFKYLTKRKNKQTVTNIGTCWKYIL